ncbi:hypothetical protein PTSG_01814 [Salpingoeca rosetta]|uniref:Sialin n=1 Tax=Salpingoeca rosetta (strain ATCC 50818 / BSB-021) TaxID=946362 RepID=F2TZ14_SALR5|nr:uncharacterized protein PTSG_01814 [Salpingoeca rosetta]EGD78838.1 hypothetical protein PTSG_01814 [Salpingoeca rosetta]|eukprot:XP_004997794.1 hypothetical protein PTSG_01814 [Salpingoeca rosetta]
MAGDGDEALLALRPPNLPWYRATRYTLAIWAFFGFLNVYALRVNLSVAIVKMSSEYNWGNWQSSIVLSSFFYGYIVTQLPGGWLATRFGGKLVFAYGVLCTTVLTLLTPLASERLPVLVALRIVEGLGEGVTYPAMHAMWAKWAPPAERSQLATIAYSGAFLGTVVALPASGALADSNFLGGWPSVFYVFGAIGCVWFVFWMLLIADSPAKHKRISAEERDYIMGSISAVQGKQEHVPTPWKAIFTSVPVYAIIVNHTTQNWGFYTLLTCLPTYFNDVLQFNISSSGIYASLPYLALFLVTLAGGQLADYFRVHNILSTTWVRKLHNTTAYTIAVIFLVLAGYTGKANVSPTDPGLLGSTGLSKSEALAVTYLTISTGALGLTQSGFNINHLDVSPRFAGVLMGITNGFATIPGFVAPTVAGAIASCGLCDNDKSPFNGTYWEGPNKCPPTNGTVAQMHRYHKCTIDDAQHQWRLVFFISAGVFAFGSLVFLIFGSGKVQPFNTPSSLLRSDAENGTPSLTESSALLQNVDGNARTRVSPINA